ncbi:MAG: Asp-tRNA(Asn)/Glu-tRNA(Gln) amidotransferase subunit GatB [Chlamydiia bacterium]|nr:Asp-tRNA(Asn)/Glu-tRNA(Gln) amidotransferase subunit GatB [Chlamydiia bacterium]
MSHISYEEWEPVIGLEIHAQLNTRSKIFARSPNHFGDEPNTNIEFVDTGQPGALPVLNKEAVEIAVRFGCAINARVAEFSKFDRKSYFYPDSPRNFQITQFDMPIIIGGEIVADVEGKTKTFPIHHAHLEDDAGMLKHFSDFAGVDYNRAGVPLLEIVSEPCMFSPKDATAFATTLKAIMQYLGVSDCNMEEGSMRIDTNISVRPKGDKTLRNKVEIKNLNSFSYMEIGIEAEIRRQVRAYTERPHEDPNIVVPSSTVRLDLDKKETVLMRSKEEAKDYRYFPEPDLPPIILTKEYIESIQKDLPELPHQRFERYINTLKLSEYNASILVSDKELSDYYEKALKECDNASALCNWVTVEFVGRFKESGIPLHKSGILPEHIAKLVSYIDAKKITGRIAKEVADIMASSPGRDPEIIIKENPNFQAVHDTSAIEPIVDEVLSANQQSIEDFRNGKDKAFNFLVGQVMKLSKGKASPDVVKELITKKIS